MRTKIRISKTVPDNFADTHKQLVRVTRRRRLNRCEESADEIIDGQSHMGIGTGAGRCFVVAGIPDEIKEETPGSRSAAPVKTAAWIESEM